MRYIFIAALSLLLLVGARADDLDVPDGAGAQMKAFSPLLAGMMAGTICNKETDRNRAVRYVRNELGSDVSFTADQVVFLTWMAYAQQAMQTELSGGQIKPSRQYCATMARSFGRNGTQIRGLLKD